MNIIDTEIPDVKIIEPVVFGDERGFFMETWQQDKFSNFVCDVNFVQDNQSRSEKNILRGLHYQSVNTQGKLVRVIRGEVFDVAVDMRKSSPTFGKWTGVLLSEENKRQLWIPEGFAHGFYVISNDAEFVYKCTDYYNPKHEHTLAWNDEAIGITWPIPEGEHPILSQKDKQGKSFSESYLFD
ncbi:dTDP-4-dehydrorhamnose 3,5-epimerase [Mangrovibacter sp. MFB070]|uniref:dTDP-4-dehydrorhamnose 3,5-epimerase n=1 Tax=Mangrovibacter sp. MFB070 TaxID=1224318 RepID=UPI0004D8FB88|nr:dTDP-4-dehydrorhamnose 3,5-epimerase [Mangrovibacter sp. MFB070]KEA50592.1 dTDP-4-dehydrorhamnose 3,5-epimerase [Mangrovibacter sp. MFB070]